MLPWHLRHLWPELWLQWEWEGLQGISYKCNSGLKWYKSCCTTSCWERNHSDDTPNTNPTTLSINTDGVLCVALEVGQGGTGCYCTVHCVHQQRASLRLVVNSNTVKTREPTLMWPLPQHSDTCVVCSDFSSHSDWGWYICDIHICNQVS